MPDERAAAAHAGAGVLERGARRQHADVVERDQRRVARVLELREHDHGRRLYRAADEQLVVRVDELLELRHGLAHGRLGRPVEHEPERAVVGVLDDEHDRAPEVRIEQRGPGDQQLATNGVHACGR